MGAKREGFLSLATCSGKDNNAASKLVGKLNAKVAKSPDTHDSYSVSGLDPLESRKRNSSAALKRCCVLIGDGVRDDVKEHLTPYGVTYKTALVNILEAIDASLSTKDFLSSETEKTVATATSDEAPSHSSTLLQILDLWASIFNNTNTFMAKDNITLYLD